MNKNTTLNNLSQVLEMRDALTEFVRVGAAQILEQALKEEINVYLDKFKSVQDDDGHQLVIRNGYLPQRDILLGIGIVTVKQPRVRDKRPKGEQEKFTSKILPPYLRKAKTVEDFLPYLYLKGISTGDMEDTLKALLGDNASGLSGAVVSRLKQEWKQEYEDWQKRSLKDKEYVYVWTDGVYVEPRGDEDKLCLLVVIGVTKTGDKELLAVEGGYRESEQSWYELLLDLKERGLGKGPKLLTGDGSLGVWKAFNKLFGETKHQRCWFHKTGNILDKMPKSVQGKAKKMIQEIYLSPTRELALKAARHFEKTFKDKYPKAVKCLMGDLDELLTFYDFPAAHWQHIRTTNPIESSFSSVRHRTYKTKGCGSRESYKMMTYKLLKQAEGHWRKLNSPELCEDVSKGIIYVDGVRQEPLPVLPSSPVPLESVSPITVTI